MKGASRKSKNSKDAPARVQDVGPPLPPLEAPGIAGFSLKRMESSTLIPPRFVQPHRHELNEILIIRSGRSRHIIDGHVVAFRPLTLCFIPRNHVHVLEHDARLSGWLVQFSDDFLPTESIDRSWNYRAALANQLGPARTLDLQPLEMHRIELMMEMMETDYLSPSATQGQSLRHWLSLLIIEIGKLSQNALAAGQHKMSEADIFQQFTAILEQDFNRRHDVGHYAARLNVDPLALSRAVGNILGKTTKQVIEERIILEAKRNLLHSERAIKEIAFAMGYADQFHFSKTFKRLAGVAPSAFRD
jgi:AraC family transcriptional activator of pobA